MLIYNVIYSSFHLYVKTRKFEMDKPNYFMIFLIIWLIYFKFSKTYVYNVDVSSNIIVDLYYVWHLRLGHVNFDEVSFMSKHHLIPCCPTHNCKTCMLNEITRTPFKSIVRKSEI